MNQEFLRSFHTPPMQWLAQKNITPNVATVSLKQTDSVFRIPSMNALFPRILGNWRQRYLI